MTDKTLLKHLEQRIERLESLFVQQVLFPELEQTVEVTEASWPFPVAFRPQ